MSPKDLNQLKSDVNTIIANHEKLEKSIRILMTGVQRSNKKVNVLYQAMVGNDLGTDGVIPRIEKLESKTQRIFNLKTKAVGVIIGLTTAWVFVLDLLRVKFFK